MKATPVPILGTAASKDTGTTEGTIPLRIEGGALVGPLAWSELTDTPTTLGGYGITDAATSAQGSLADTAVQPGELATVATTGAYSDLSGTPTLATVATTGAYSDLSGTPTLATVATTGAYSDLSGAPTLATVATTGSYNDLLDKPIVGNGTVTSVGLALPTQFTVSNSPVTTSGTLTADWATQTQGHVLAAPSGTNGVPTFRALVATDIPTLNQNTTGTAGNVTGTVAIANGGTGATTAGDARANLNLVPGTDVQPYDSDLAAIAALNTTGLIDRTGSGTATTRATGTTGLAVLAAANEAAARTAIGSPAFAGDSTATITTNSVIRSQIDSSGNVTSTIPGGSTLLPEFKCRAWVNFDGDSTPPTARASGNVSSITRNASGEYTINFTTAMPDANYAVVATEGRAAGAAGTGEASAPAGANPSTTSVRVSVANSGGSTGNKLYVSVLIFR